MVKYTTNTPKTVYTKINDNGLIKLGQAGDHNALAEMWLRHISFFKGMTAKHFREIMPNFEDDARSFEVLWQNRMATSYINFVEAVKKYNPYRGIPFFAYFNIINKLRFCDEKRENSAYHARAAKFIDNYDMDTVECVEENETEGYDELISAIKKGLAGDKTLNKFFCAYVDMFDKYGYVDQTEMAHLLGTSRQNINTKFKKIHAVLATRHLDKKFLEILSFNHNSWEYAQKTFQSESHFDGKAAA